MTAPTQPDEELRRRLDAQRARQQARTVTTNGRAASGAPSPGSRRLSAKAQRWMRWLHVYSSMIAFLVILFFGVTGLLLNHPTWVFGDEITTSTLEGTLPETVIVDDGRIEFLAVSEYLRSEHGIGGEVNNFDQVGDEGSINYSGPGFGASVRFDVTTLTYRAELREEGFVNEMRDLHTGSDTGSVWDWAIDVAAVFLVFVAVTGLGIQLLMRKRRGSALAWLAAGSIVVVGVIWFTMI